LDGMALAAIQGRGSAELVRFWGEPPLVREPDTLIYGLQEVDPPEQEFLSRSPMRHMYAADIQQKGAGAAAQAALGQLHTDTREFMIHLDLDVIAQEEFAATNVPGSGGLSFSEVQTSLNEFSKQKNLLGLQIGQYNPEKDADGSAARKVVELLVEVLSTRLAALSPAPPSSPVGEPSSPEPSSSTAA
jgi:arginase